MKPKLEQRVADFFLEGLTSLVARIFIACGPDKCAYFVGMWGVSDPMCLFSQWKNNLNTTRGRTRKTKTT